jgi:hypothetical protein
MTHRRCCPHPSSVFRHQRSHRANLAGGTELEQARLIEAFSYRADLARHPDMGDDLAQILLVATACAAMSLGFTASPVVKKSPPLVAAGEFAVCGAGVG